MMCLTSAWLYTVVFVLFNYRLLLVHTVHSAAIYQFEACFKKLLKDRKFQVRRCISSSLHDIAAVLGQVTTQDRYTIPYVRKD